MDRTEQRRVVEALILASPEPISAIRLAKIAPECSPALAKELVNELNEQYYEQQRAFEIWEVAGGYQVRTRAEFSGYLQQLQKERPLRLSRAALETLAIVSYKQPATRADIEDVRGVDVGATLKSLMDRGLVKITGHKEVPGRPMLYGTTRRFLEVFGLESLKALPPLRELEELAREQKIAADDDGEVDGEVVDDAAEAQEAQSGGEVAEGIAIDEAAGAEAELEVSASNEEISRALEPEANGVDEIDEVDETEAGVDEDDHFRD